MLFEPYGVQWYTTGMPRKGDATYTQTAIRIPSQWVTELHEIAGRLSRPGIPVTQADAMRAAIAEGIAVLRKDLGITRTPGTAETSATMRDGIRDPEVARGKPVARRAKSKEAK